MHKETVLFGALFWPGDHREEQEGPLEEPEFGPQPGSQALYWIKGYWLVVSSGRSGFLDDVPM
jgi:hypothetical protein